MTSGHVYEYLQLHRKLRLFPGQSELTIASGAISIDSVGHTVDTESDAASDALATINGGSHGDLLILSAANAARTVVIEHGTGNVFTPGQNDINLEEVTDSVLLFRQGTNWIVLGHQTLFAEPSKTLVATGTILSAAVLTLFATPVTVIPALGAGRCALVESVRWFLKHNGTDYVATAGEDLVLKYTNASGSELVQLVDGDGLPEASADASMTVIAAATLTLLANTPVVAHVLSGNWATGDGDLHYEIVWRNVELDLSA